jgi:hypothetical protein
MNELKSSFQKMHGKIDYLADRLREMLDQYPQGVLHRHGSHPSTTNTSASSSCTDLTVKSPPNHWQWHIPDVLIHNFEQRVENHGHDHAADVSARLIEELLQSIISVVTQRPAHHQYVSHD